MVARPSSTLYCNLSIHAKYLSRRSVFFVASPGKSSHNLFLAYFQLLYTVVIRLDFKKFIGSGCKVVPLPTERWSRGSRRTCGRVVSGGTARSPSIRYQSWYFWMPHPRPLVLHFGIPSRFGGGICWTFTFGPFSMMWLQDSKLLVTSDGPGIFCEGARKNAGFMAKHWYQTGGVSEPNDSFGNQVSMLYALPFCVLAPITTLT